MLRLAADVDSLTGVATRRRGIEVLERYIRLAQRQSVPISVAVIDLDHFKDVNDRYGHLTGDMVLRRVAAVLSGCFRGEDVVARWGGEEFLVLLPGLRLSAACQRAEAMRRDVAQTHIDGGKLRVTLSLGVAELDSGEALDDCLRRCDQALYRAKDAGRNTVIVAKGTMFATLS